jgi:hypothetical protein
MGWPFRLVDHRHVLRLDRRLDLYTFDCRECGVWHIEEGDAAEYYCRVVRSSSYLMAAQSRPDRKKAPDAGGGR